MHRQRQHPFLDQAAPIPFVHRGGPTGLPENTLVAFERAYRLGFRYFETDVHATSDGELVAFHDRSLRRLAGARVAISSLSAAQVADVRIDEEPVPLLVDLLRRFPDARFNIDPKSDAAVRPLAKLLAEEQVLDRVCVASFSDIRLSWMRTAFGDKVCSAAGPRELARARWAVERGRTPDLPRVDVLQLPPGPRLLPLVDQRFVEAAHHAGIPVHVWTVNDPTAMGRLLTMGVDGVMSDDAIVLRSVFEAHGLWLEGH
ncbi:MAG TPA: glycerophosphodiester phosphodiesterase family protein [Actinomycetes bacterium]|nr:glycerophosphodiester phosphodiesterase family protein [Actinomycetes bacterium]